MAQTTEDSDRHHDKQRFSNLSLKGQRRLPILRAAFAGKLDHLLGSRTVSICAHLALFFFFLFDFSR